jgi:hypothetical protein
MRTPKIGDQVLFIPTPASRKNMVARSSLNLATRSFETQAAYEVTKLTGTVCYVHKDGTVNISYLLPSGCHDRCEDLYLHQNDPLPDGVGGYCVYPDKEG